MQLIQLLQESSSLSLADLKKAMQKDAKTAPLFKNNLSLDGIEDKTSFLSSVKYYLLNNENVRAFVSARENVNRLSKTELGELRKLRAETMTEDDLENLQEFTKALFKDHSSVIKGVMSSEAKKELMTWVNKNGRYYDLPPHVQTELLSIPSLRPSKKILVYRGILFSSSSMVERATYKGTLEKGPGLKFIESIRKGGRQVDLKWDRASSWTVSKEIAERFAKYGPADSSFSATLQWLGRMADQKAIDGDLGYVISTFANPEDILIDFNLYNSIESKHGNEGEVILKKGTYLARVVKKFTIEGEADPDAEVSELNSATSTLPTMKEFAKAASLPPQASILDDLTGPVFSYSAIDVLRKQATFKKLILNSTTTAAIHSFDTLVGFYNDKLANVNQEDLRADKQSSSEMRKAVAKLKSFIDSLSTGVRHGKFQSPTNVSAKGKLHQLTGEEYRATITASDIKDVERDLLTSGRIVDSAREFTSLGRYVGVTVPSTFKQMGAARQDPIIDSVISGFFRFAGLDMKEDRKENIKTMINLIKKAQRNAIMLRFVRDVHEILGEFNE